ncbi:MAG TPA: rhomboid family intramembrane serine protease [Blastocatellia bacterium]|nr:rhomboid family intramembrane serine protease [Blastocatellia bacterium]
MLFPIGDDNSARRTFPVVTYGLIALNVLFFFVELNGGESFIRQWSVIPRRLVENPVADFPTVLTAMFMHGGWLHLGGNMLYLWIFGDNVEDHWGSVKFLLFYLVCGIAATIAQVAVNPDSNIPNLGASGAIAGILGAYLVLFPSGRVRVLMGRALVHMPAIAVIGFWILLQFINGIGSIANTAETGGVAYMAHIGGFVAGLALAAAFRGSSTGRLQPTT